MPRSVHLHHVTEVRHGFRLEHARCGPIHVEMTDDVDKVTCWMCQEIMAKQVAGALSIKDVDVGVVGLTGLGTFHSGYSHSDYGTIQIINQGVTRPVATIPDIAVEARRLLDNELGPLWPYKLREIINKQR